MMEEKQILKPVYVKAGRDLKGVENETQFYGAITYLRSIGIEPRFFLINKDIISDVTENYALKVIKEYEKLKGTIE